MVTLINRPPRLDLDIPFNFKVSELLISGRTVNVSESGLLARLELPVELWMVGDLSMTVGAYYIELEARVARTHAEEYGLSFLINSESDRRAVSVLNDYALSLLTGVPMRQSRAY